MKWLKDEDFIRDKVPMTKENIRILTMGYLSIYKGCRFLDIGSGTGSISVQGAVFGANVTSVEQKELGISLLKQNAEKQGVKIHAIHGQAPEALPDEKFDRVFIGGSGGALLSIFEYLEGALESDGIVVANFITLKNTWETYTLLKEFNYRDVEVQLIQTAAMDKLGLMRGENPIYILKGVKK
ncbi:MAG: precorrin-6Y C5,15-methyltransferase (decarboxylating) subunit CbiT [Tissierellia bacterium]|nr:precorrin-6Y C5,15-methyltransferase (decarboxylating) subunit CbiT [Tissierellia bacterium]